MQKALHLVVVEILGRGRDMAEHVLALRALANFLQIVIALVGEEFFAEFKHDVSPMRALRLPDRRPTGWR